MFWVGFGVGSSTIDGAEQSAIHTTTCFYLSVFDSGVQVSLEMKSLAYIRDITTTTTSLLRSFDPYTR